LSGLWVVYSDKLRHCETTKEILDKLQCGYDKGNKKDLTKIVNIDFFVRVQP